MSENYTFNPHKTAEENAAFKDRSRTGGDFRSPHQVDYSKLIPGDYVELRFLDLSKEAFVEIPCRRAGIQNPKNKKKMTIVVRDFGADVMSNLVDQYGTALTDCKATFLYRMPVYVFGIRSKDKNGAKNYEEVNALKFLEFGPGLSKSIEELETQQDGAWMFNQKTGLPHYDIRLSIIEGNGDIPKNYKFEAVVMGNNQKMAESFGQSLVERFSEDELLKIKESWVEVTTAMREFESLEDVKRRLAPKTDKDSTEGRTLTDRVSDSQEEFALNN